MNRIIPMLGILLLLGSCAKEGTKAQAPKLPINLASVPTPDFGLVLIALAKGYFDAEGLAVSVKSFAVGKLALASVIKGESDLATAFETPIVFAILGGERICIPAVIASSDRNFVLVARKDAPISKPEDLAGKSIGLPMGTAGEYFLVSFLTAHGIPGGRVRIVDTEAEALLPALLSGKVDSAVLWSPLNSQAIEALGEKGIVFSGESIYSAYDCIVGESAFVKGNPKAVQGFIRALLRAEGFMAKNPEQALSIIAKATSVDESSLRPMLDLFRFKVSLDQSLLLVLEDESRWAMRVNPKSGGIMPSYLDYIYSDALLSLAPERVRLIR